MPEVETRLLDSLGGFRIRRLKTRPDWPVALLNPKDKQAYAIDEGPVYPKIKPVRCNSLDELLTLPPPEIPTHVDRWQMHVEDNAVWPYSSASVEERALRPLKYDEYLEEAAEAAANNATRANQVNLLVSLWSYVLLGGAGLGFIIIAAILLSFKFGGQTPPPEAAYLGLFLIGAVASREKLPSIPLDDWFSREVAVPLIGKNDPWVLAAIFDDPEIGGTIWDVEMRESEWAKHREELTPGLHPTSKLAAKKKGVAVGAFGGAAVLGVVISSLMMVLLGGGFAAGLGFILGIIFGGPIGAAIGWVVGNMLAELFGYRSYYTLNRVVQSGEVTLQPRVHSFCRNESVDEHRGILALRSSSMEDAEDEEDFSETVYRGTTFFEDLRARDEEEEIKAPRENMSMLQIGTFAFMGFGSMGLAILAVLITAE